MIHNAKFLWSIPNEKWCSFAGEWKRFEFDKDELYYLYIGQIDNLYIYLDIDSKMGIGANFLFIKEE